MADVALAPRPVDRADVSRHCFPACRYNLMLSPATKLFSSTATLAGKPIAHHGYYQGKVW